MHLQKVINMSDFIHIYGNYKIDFLGNVFSKKLKLKIRDKGKCMRVCLNGKDISYARLVATYLVYNPNNFDRFIFRDGNYKNCSVENIKWVSDQKYNMYLYKKQMKNRILERETALKKCTDPIICEYYKTGDLNLINAYFTEISKIIQADYWQDISGFVYIKIREKLERFGLLYCLKKYIMSRLRYYQLTSYEVSNSQIF